MRCVPSATRRSRSFKDIWKSAARRSANLSRLSARLDYMLESERRKAREKRRRRR
jgi:hypothetical protein